MRKLVSHHTHRNIYTVVADYSLQIEKHSFDTLFKKIEPNAAWSEGSHVAWSVMTPLTLTEAEIAAHVVARSWLNSEIMSWSNRVDKASKVQNLKDADNVLILTLLPSKSPLSR